MQSNHDVVASVMAIQRALLEEFPSLPTIEQFTRGKDSAKRAENFSAYQEKVKNCRVIAKQYKHTPPEEGGLTIYNLLMRKFGVGNSAVLAANLSIDLGKQRIFHEQLTCADVNYPSTPRVKHVFILFSINANAEELSDDLFKDVDIFDFFKKLDNTYYVADPFLNIVFSVHDIPKLFYDYIKKDSRLYDAIHYFDINMEELASYERKAEEAWNGLKAATEKESKPISSHILQTSFDKRAAVLKEKATAIFNPQDMSASAWEVNRENDTLWIEFEMTEDNNNSLLDALHEHIVKNLREKAFHANVMIREIPSKNVMRLSISPTSAINYVSQFDGDATNKKNTLRRKSLA